MEELAYELVTRNCTVICWVMQQVVLPKYSSCRKDLVVASCNMVGESDSIVVCSGGHECLPLVALEIVSACLTRPASRPSCGRAMVFVIRVVCCQKGLVTARFKHRKVVVCTGSSL